MTCKESNYIQYHIYLKATKTLKNPLSFDIAYNVYLGRTAYWSYCCALQMLQLRFHDHFTILMMLIFSEQNTEDMYFLEAGVLSS